MRKAWNGDNKLTIFVEGRIDANNSAQFGDETEKAIEGIEELTFDFSGLEYISSSGLRVLMMAIKYVAKNGGQCKIVGVSEKIYEILETTGFTGLCDVETQGA